MQRNASKRMMYIVYIYLYLTNERISYRNMQEKVYSHWLKCGGSEKKMNKCITKRKCENENAMKVYRQNKPELDTLFLLPFMVSIHGIQRQLYMLLFSTFHSKQPISMNQTLYFHHALISPTQFLSICIIK